MMVAWLRRTDDIYLWSFSLSGCFFLGTVFLLFVGDVAYDSAFNVQYVMVSDHNSFIPL